MLLVFQNGVKFLKKTRCRYIKNCVLSYFFEYIITSYLIMRKFHEVNLITYIAMVQRVGHLLCPWPGIALKTYQAHKQNGLAFIQLFSYSYEHIWVFTEFVFYFLSFLLTNINL